MIKITETEQQKLKSIAYDEVAMEALKKFFLIEFLEHEADSKTLVMLSNSFKEMDKMKVLQPEESQRRNIV